MDYETTCVIHDPNADVNVAVRVWFAQDLPFTEHRIVGVFRLDDDSEIDFTGLSPTEQDKINRTCENEINNGTVKK